MRSYLKKISVLALAAAANAELIKRDPYWIKMSDIIQQVRPDFYYGVSTQRNFFNNPKYKDIISTYNLQVAGNECKFYTIQGSEKENFKPCDESIEFAKKFDAKFRGHTLFWPAYSSEWFKNYSDDIEVTKEYILDYVTRVLDHYKDEEDIIYWDVINEAVLDDSTEDNIKFRTGSDSSNEFKGWDTYTEDIFTLAREHTNPNVKLIYNDYNAENNNGNYKAKTGAVFNYIKSMKEKDIPIDGVGLQMHISCNYYPNYDQLTELIDKYAEIGVEVHITEIDVSMEYCKTHDQQRELYMDVFKACFDNENCKVFTVWGSYDSESWKGAENEPLPFDEKMYPKDIYFDMLEYVLDKLPEDATYPTPTATKPVEEETTEAAEDENITYLIEPGTFMIDPQWQSWSWGSEELTIDDDGNVSATLIEEEYGALSLHYSSKFNGGKLHVEMMIDKSAPVAVVAHTIKGEEFVELDRIEDVSTEEFQAFDFEIPAVKGDNYDRISLQDAWGKAITITVHEMYLIPNTDSSSSATSSSSANTNRYDIIKEGDFMLVGNWQNWSWGVEDNEFDEEGNLVSYITAGTYGGVSFKRSDSVIFGAGTLHFKAKVNDTNAQIQILFHTIDDEYVNVGSVKDVSDEEMMEYNIEVDEPTGELYDRITIQDVANNGLTLYLNDVYFLAAELTEEPTDIGDVEEPTDDVEETTEEPEDELPAEALEGYCILKDGEVDSEWQNWSWGVESAEIVDNGLANVLTAGEWGGISFKRGDDLLLGAGTLYFKAKADVEGATLQVVVHNTAADEYYNQGTIKDISTNKMTLYSMEIESPSSPSTMYDRVTIQDIYNEGVTITIDDVYYVATEVAQKTDEEVTPAEEPTEVDDVEEPVKEEPVEEVNGDRYDILIGGEVDPEWQNWSWGVESAEIDEDGNLANVVTAGEWGGISFKRGDSKLFGAGTLYFKAKADTAKAVIQIVAHSTAADEYYNMETISDLSTTKMTQYAIAIKEPESEMYDRFTIQDVYNKGVIIYLNDVYFVADPSAEVEEPTEVEVEQPTETEPEEEEEPVVEGDNVYYILKKGEVDPEWQNWSWGVESAEVDEDGNLANVLTAGEWAGISFKRSDSKLFTTGTLYFKAKADTSKAILQVVAHSTTDDDDYQIMEKITDLSTTKMTQYSVQIKEPKGEKYDRFTLQDVYNKGVTVYLNDIYFVADEAEEEVDPNCWAAELGFKCCKTTTRVILEDDNGAWGVENEFWCGIIEDKEDTCWSTRLGYPCCKENNVLYEINEHGSWGYENDQWCGIAKADESCEFSALGYECCPDAEVVEEDEHKWGFVDGKWCGVAF